MKSNKKIVMLALAVGVTFLPNAALTDTTRRSPSYNGLMTAGPYYDSSSKSYFELRRGSQINWKKANRVAQDLIYKGRQGRLAIIRNAKTHSFLIKNFTIKKSSFIGLRMFCKRRYLQWIDGSDPANDNFSAWSTTMHEEYTCRAPLHSNTNEYRAIYLPTGSFNWQITGEMKAYSGYLVEYPAPPRTNGGDA